VRREAVALAQAGHSVTVVGSADPTHPAGPGAPIGPVQVTLVAPDPGYPYIRAPWRYVEAAVADARGRLQQGPRRWPGAVRKLLAATIVLPWVALRGGWVSIVNRLLGRPVNMHALDFAHRWRADITGWAQAALVVAPAADIHHAHDLEALPAAILAARRDAGLVVYDKHELFTGKRWLAAQPGWARRAVEVWERRTVRSVSALITVNTAVAAVLQARLHPRRTTVVHNCPPRWTPPSDASDPLRAALGLAAETPIALYHGGLARHRGIEELIAAIREPGLEAVHAVFLGYGAFEAELRAMAADPAQRGRVHVLPAVTPDELLAWIAPADVAVLAIQPNTQNHRLSTPNKLFEAIAAGVPVVASDFPAIRPIVADDPGGPLGVLVDPTDVGAVAGAIRGLLDLPPSERATLRARCFAAARERWNWEIESARLVALYAELVALRATEILPVEAPSEPVTSVVGPGSAA
ncbi:MAG TPA: glycosyltransferase, partial [Candidatus Binatus sp.]|nr:glycosyltransferase [Candidatus Binatus sp.]